MTNTISDQLRPILQSTLSGNRNWLPNQVYAGVVQEILGNGSIAVLINNKVYQAITHIPVHSGDLLNLRLLGTTPEPRFAITGLATAAQHAEPAVAVQSSSAAAVAMFSKLNPGIEGLATMLLQYPEQLARISPQLQPLLAAISSNILADTELARPGKLKSHMLASGFFYDRHEAAGVEAVDTDLKGLLMQLLGALQNKRTLTLLNNGQPGFIAHRPAASPANTAASLAQYTAQDDNSLARDLKHIITQNAESTLLQIVSSQLTAQEKSDNTVKTLIMKLMIGHEDTFVPLELELRQHTLAEEFWEAVFTIELPESGKMQWTITVTPNVKNPSVRVQLCSNKEDTRLHMAGQARFLGQLMELQDLILTNFSCIETEGF